MNTMNSTGNHGQPIPLVTVLCVLKCLDILRSKLRPNDTEPEADNLQLAERFALPEVLDSIDEQYVTYGNAKETVGFLIHCLYGISNHGGIILKNYKSSIAVKYASTSGWHELSSPVDITHYMPLALQGIVVSRPSVVMQDVQSHAKFIKQEVALRMADLDAIYNHIQNFRSPLIYGVVCEEHTIYLLFKYGSNPQLPCHYDCLFAKLLYRELRRRVSLFGVRDPENLVHRASVLLNEITPELIRTHDMTKVVLGGLEEAALTCLLWLLNIHCKHFGVIFRDYQKFLAMTDGSEYKFQRASGFGQGWTWINNIYHRRSRSRAVQDCTTTVPFTIKSFQRSGQLSRIIDRLNKMLNDTRLSAVVVEGKHLYGFFKFIPKPPASQPAADEPGMMMAASAREPAGLPLVSTVHDAHSKERRTKMDVVHREGSDSSPSDSPGPSSSDSDGYPNSDTWLHVFNTQMECIHSIQVPLNAKWYRIVQNIQKELQEEIDASVMHGWTIFIIDGQDSIPIQLDHRLLYADTRVRLVSLQDGLRSSWVVRRGQVEKHVPQL